MNTAELEKELESNSRLLKILNENAEDKQLELVNIKRELDKDWDNIAMLQQNEKRIRALMDA